MSSRVIIPYFVLLIAMAAAGPHGSGRIYAQDRAGASAPVPPTLNPYLDVPAAIRNMYHPQRFPDIYLLTQPHCLFTSRSEFDRMLSKGQKPETIAGHGSLWNYDSDIPIIFYGKGIKEGFLGGEADLTDIAPTLAYLAGVQRPAAATGRILHEIIRPEAAQWKSEQRPKVIVLFSLDQCRSEYIRVFENAFSFLTKHVLAGGSNFTQGRVPNAKTETAVSHASIGTGAIAGLHGISGNNIMQPDGGYSLAIDDGNTGPNYGHGSLSPHNLLVPTLADEMDRRYGNESVIISSSSYGRAAVGIAGHGAYYAKNEISGAGADKDIVFAANWRSGVPYTNTDYYLLPRYLDARINADIPIKQWLMKYYGLNLESAQWTHDLVLEDKSPFSTTRKAFGTNSASFPWGRALNFSHPMINRGRQEPDKLQRYHDYKPGITALSDKYAETIKTPFFDLWNIDLNLMAMKEERVGRDNAVDLVFFHLKSLDSIGHRYGIYSDEIYSYMFYADYMIEKVIGWLDANVGKGNYTAVFFGDHGAANVIGRGRWIVAEDVREALEAQFGKGAVRQLAGDQLWLDRKVLKKGGATIEDVARWIETNFPWAVRAYTKGEVRGAELR